MKAAATELQQGIEGGEGDRFKRGSKATILLRVFIAAREFCGPEFCEWLGDCRLL